MPRLTAARELLEELNAEFGLDGDVERSDAGVPSISLYYTRASGIEQTLNIWIEDGSFAVEANIWKDMDGVRYWTHLTPRVIPQEHLRPVAEAKIQQTLTMQEWDLSYEKELDTEA